MKRVTTLVAAGIVTLALASTPSAFAGGTAADGSRDSGASGRAPVKGLNAPRGMDIAPGGYTVVAEADGTVSRAFRFGKKKGTTKKLGKVPPNFLAPSVAIGFHHKRREIWALTAGGEPGSGAGSLYRWGKDGKRHLVADISAYVAKHPDPYDLAPDAEDSEGPANESNPYGVAARRKGGVYVADAANNAVFRVSRTGKVRLVARVKPRMVATPEGMGLPPEIPAEAVTTSVTEGPDGSVYIGELRGFPGTPGTSQVWRVAPGAHGVVCKPAKPNKGKCTRYVDGFTSIVDLDTGRGGALFVSELSKQGWMALESEEPDPSAAIGAVIRVGHDRSIQRELGAGKVLLPGDVAIGPKGGAWVAGPVFADLGPGAVYRVR